MPLLQRDEPYSHWEWSDPATGDLLRIVPERGGLVSGWRCSGREMLYLDLERFADPSLSVRGGIPILFPICGGLPGNSLPLPEGDVPLPQHGFARLVPWTLGSLPDGQGVRMELQDTPTSWKNFPFRFALALDLRLSPGTLAIDMALSNPGERPFPFSFGLHPYFIVSDPRKARVVGLPSQCIDQLTMRPVATADQLERLSEGVDLLAGPVGTVQLQDGGAGIGVELQMQPPLDLVVVWSDPPRPMVCLEPWTGPRGALITGDRRLEVAPGETCLLHCRYVLVEL